MQRQPRQCSRFGLVLAGLVLAGPVSIWPAIAHADEPVVAPRLNESQHFRIEPVAAPGLNESEHFTIEPVVAPRLNLSEHFTIDPVFDGVLIGAGVGFSELLSLVLGTGEIRPSVPGPTSVLLGIDRSAVTQTIDPNAGRNSTIGLYAAYAYAVADPILTGFRDGRRSFVVDAILYAESVSLTAAFTEMTKIAVRRPRPIDYSICDASPDGTCKSNTDLQLSFFSGHASATGAITGTATYLAFVRSPHTARPWITLGVGTALTAFVSYERVRSGEHFPTDVIMGSLAGAAIGVLVPHIHRRPHYHKLEFEATPTWIGLAPMTHGQGSSVTAGWIF
jgi:membrane-associated phospholipid phosphatase